MDVKLRPGTPGDAEACGQICYDAFAAIAAAHNMPCDVPSPRAATDLLASLLARPGIFGVVAEAGGMVAGSNFLDERGAIAGVGPVTVHPAVQNAGVGRELMVAVLDRAATQGAAGVRLVQAAYHTRSLALYGRLGFEVRESLACLQGPPIGAPPPAGRTVRPATDVDVATCDSICRAVHGHDRSSEVAAAVASGQAVVVERDGRVAGYSTGLSFWAHTVAESVDDVTAMIGSAAGFGGPGLLVPMRQGTLLRWCLDHGLRVVQVMTLMTTGLYNEPLGAYLPSIKF